MPTLWWQFMKRHFFTVVFMAMLVLGFVPTSICGGEQLSDDLFDVSFPDESYGWACGRWGCVLHTTNGGDSWVRQKSGTDFTLSSICFVDRETGWVVGDGGTILHTADGGITWEKQKGPRLVVEGGQRWGYAGFTTKEEETDVRLFYMGVHFLDRHKGWIVAERTHILYTEDGGNTWQIQFSDEDFVLKSVSFCDEQNGWAVGEYGYVYHTNDGGKTWVHQAGDFDVSEETGEVVGGNFLFDVVAINPQTAWVVGIDGYVARTTDAGATWQKVTEDVPKTHLFGIAFDGEGTIAIGGGAALLFTSDKGEGVAVPQVEPPIKYGWLYGLSQRVGEGFVAVGKGGWIYLSDRKATSWKSSASP